MYDQCAICSLGSNDHVLIDSIAKLMGLSRESVRAAVNIMRNNYGRYLVESGQSDRPLSGVLTGQHVLVTGMEAWYVIGEVLKHFEPSAFT